jgi:osmotically-inducible protein OsmY
MKKTFFVKSLLCALAILAGAGCSTIDYDQNLPDSEIVDDVTNRLQADVIANQFKVGVTCVDGVVTLYGNVPDGPDRPRIASVALGTPGVKEVREDFYP